MNYLWLATGAHYLEENSVLEDGEGPQETKRLDWRDGFIEWMSEALWKGNTDINHDDLVTLMMSTFYDLNDDLEQFYHDFPSEIKMRNALLASYMVVLLVSTGYCHRDFLRDAFNVCLFLDYPYCQTSWSESEKRSLIRARSYHVLNDDEKEIINRMNETYTESLIPLLKNNIKYKVLVHLLKQSFERLDGEGFPLNLGYNQFSDLELSMLFLINTLDLKTNYVGVSASGFLKKTMKSDSSVLSKRLYGLMKKAWDDENSDFIKVVGL